MSGGRLSFTTSLLGAEVYSQRFASHAQNLAGASAVAGRERETFITSFDTSFNVGGVQASTLRHLNQAGLPIPSQINTHFSISGQGYAIVRDQPQTTGILGFVRDCTFVPDQNLNFRNNVGQFLQVYLTDSDGTPIDPDVNTPGKLTTLSMNGVSGIPQATTKISNILQLPATANGGTNYVQPVSAYDSLGIARNLTFTWTKSNATLTSSSATQAWVLTITAPSGVTVNPPYASGSRIEFNSSGAPVLYDAGGTNAVLPPNLSVSWGATSGVANSAITLDFGAIGSFGGIVSSGTEFLIRNLKPDGNPPGVFQNIEFDEDGFGTVTFTNGVRKKYCRIPLANFNNVNGLSERTPGVFNPSAESGPYQFTFPKNGGTGALVAGTYEGSSTNTTAVYIKMIEDQKNFAGNLKVIETIKHMLEKFEQI